MNNEATLFVSTRQKLTLADALSSFGQVIGAEPATALLYSPRRCTLARFTGGALHGPDGQPVDTAGVFEARVFCETAELRWLNDPGPEQCHRAVILSEKDRTGMLEGWELEKNQPRVIETLNQTYLLWGEGTGRPVSNGWSELAMARIGALSVPVANVAENQRVRLRSVEYVIKAEHGNAVIFDERLVKLEVASG
jgi:CRISPR-associated protein (TIGR03984 family)